MSSRSDWERAYLANLRTLLGPQAELADVHVAPADDASSDGSTTYHLRRSEQRPTYFDYQAQVIEEMNGLLRQGGRGLLTLPTGAGKTRTALGSVLETAVTKPGQRICWMAPTQELLHQASATLRQLWAHHGTAPDLAVQLGGTPRTSTQIWFATPQLVGARLRAGAGLGIWSAVIFDEAHQMAAPTFRAAATGLARESDDMAIVGLSATPGRASERDTDDLVDLFGGRLLRPAVLGRQPVEELQRRGVLAKLAFRSLSKRPPADLNESERLTILFRACRQLAGLGRQLLVFTSTVPAAAALSHALTKHAVAADWISGDMDSAQRSTRLDDFASRATQVLCNQKLLMTGYDCPGVTDVLLQGRVSSPIQYEQLVGRVARGRATGGTAVGTVWQFEDHLALHGLPQSYYRFRSYGWDG